MSDDIPFLDGIGFFGNLFEYSMVIALGGSALLVFLYLWRKGRLDLDQEPAIAMMQTDDNEPPMEAHETRPLHR